VKFSPDGKWIVSGDQEGLLRIWDLTAGKLIHEFKDHTNAITKVRFHPNEYFLASSSADRTVKFWDLDTFSLVETAGPEATSVRAIEFTPSGEAMFSATQDCLKVWTWEPVLLHDYVDMQWSKLHDMCLRDDKLMGVTLNQSFVGVWVVDLARVAPFSKGEVSLASPQPEPSVYMKENTAPKNEAGGFQDQESKQPTMNNNNNAADEVVVTQDLIDNLKSTRIEDEVAFAGAGAGAAATSPISKTIGTGMGDSFFNIGMLNQNPNAGGGGPPPSTTASVKSPAPPQVASFEGEDAAAAAVGPSPSLTATTSGPGPVGLDFESFASTSNTLPSEEDVEQYRSDKQIAHDLLQKHEVMTSILSSRLTKMRAVREVWQKGNMRKTVSYVLAMKDKSVLVDTIQPILKMKAMLKLDMICSLIPPVCDLVSEGGSSEVMHERWTIVSLEAITQMHSMFADLIISVCSAAPSSGIDLHFEDKLEYCQRARSHLLSLRPKLALLKAHSCQQIALKSLDLDKQLSVYLA
jgi:katanin p80 WD40 repeat-containing subunit B1